MTAAARILELTQAHRDRGYGADAQMALTDISDPQLRQAMIENARLQEPLRARMKQRGAVAVPKDLPPFRGETALLQLLAGDLDVVRRDIGLAWYANVLSSTLLQGAPLIADTPHVVIRRALAHRDLAPSSAELGEGVPSSDTVVRAGRLCIAAWCGGLPDAPALIAVELGAMTPGDIRDVGEEIADQRARRRQLTERWLNMAVDEVRS